MIYTSLDNTKTNCNNWCGTTAVVGYIQIEGKRGYGHARLRCKQWLCPECGPKKAYKLQKAIEEIAREMDLTRFLTLTLDPKKLYECENLLDYIRYIRKVWHKFRTYIKLSSVNYFFSSATINCPSSFRK